MRSNLNVKFHFDRLHCHDEADGWGNAEPYLWTVFFKIDGTTCRLNEALKLEGTATIFTTPGSHGNLGDSDVDAGDTVSIPSAIGLKEFTITPIPVPDSAKALGIEDVPAVAGAIVILMEEDNVSDDGAEAGHAALNAGVQSALNNIIPTLGFTKTDITKDEIKAMNEKISSEIKQAIRNQQNAFENIWSILNADDEIGTEVFKFSGDELLQQSPIPLNVRWKNDNGDWELFGNVSAVEQASCPANVVKDVFDSLFGKSSSRNSLNALYAFRDNEFRKYQGLESWWALAQRNSSYLQLALKNKEVAQAAIALFKDAPEILKDKDKPLSEKHYANIVTVLKHLGELSDKDRQARKDISRSIDALNTLKGKSLNTVFETLSKVQPARYPDVKELERILKPTVPGKDVKK
jgi:hypothetical protein